MTNESVTADHPTINKIRLSDLKDVLVKGLADFNAMPTHLVFFCLIYPIVTVIFARIYAGYDLLQYAFPLLAGYTLIGPLVAVGMYELSRRREQGLDHSRMKAFHVLQRRAIRPISVLGLLLMVIYLAWLFVAEAIFVKYFGTVGPVSITAFAADLFTTDTGLALISVGTGAGFVFATVVFTLSVISFPMLLDRDVGVVTAVLTSIKAVLANPITMAAWGIIVAYIMVVAALPFFIGLAIALPVLGHSTWHLYRKVVQYS
ncbi:MAG: DUF2189 domain-containing protein [Proteobacteria bacterium]|nr:DUF2189 domain-containing protein [Pseudomonadota bacterium]